MKLYNTLSRTIENFIPLDDHKVKMYTCGPTVYDYTHIGHMRKYYMDDILKHTLIYNGFSVNHVMNITDVGHLQSDGDEGEDKLEKGAKKFNKTVWEVAQFFTDYFNISMDSIGISKPTTVAKVTDNIPEMISLIKKLEEKGHTYITDEALYFDIKSFPAYGNLSRQKIDDKQTGVRDEVVVDEEKQHPADFALWFFRKGRFADHVMHWDSPWGDGFPGWHIECSALGMKYLGETIDIHTGGVDHIPVHHENEIAQSESITGKPFVKYWVHHEHLMVEGEKMSKSLGNFVTKDTLKEKNINPYALKLLFLQTHYRQQMNFTWEALSGAQKALENLYENIRTLRSQTQRTMLSEDKLEKIDQFRSEFTENVSNDLQTPQAVAVMWQVVKSNIPSEDKLDLLYEFDHIFHLGLADVTDIIIEEIPDEIKQLVKMREEVRKNKDFTQSDILRDEILKKGFIVKDTPTGTEVKSK
ncbi:MAG: cysteine--tRNA ligase [Candidatus Roizmanbacteria bacterium]